MWVWQGLQVVVRTFEDDQEVDVEAIRDLLDGSIMNGMIKAIIFDADGPLYHRTAEVDAQKQSLLREFGFTGELHQFKEVYEKEKFGGYTRAVTVTKMFQNVLESLDVHITQEEAERFAKKFDTIQRQVTATSDAIATLELLRSGGYKICILTDSFFSAKDKWPWFKQMGMDMHLDAIVSSYDIRKLKDTPDAYQACLDQLNVNADEALFVGHQEYEMVGARAAHVSSVAVMPIANPNISADYKINTLSELPGLLGQISGHK
jgi:HAD superfamily hydrolase (TIGR01549 family)